MRRDVAFVTLNPIRNFPEDKDISCLCACALSGAALFH